MRRLSITVPLLLILLLFGCRSEWSNPVLSFGKPANLEAELAKSFGPIERRLQLGEGWVALSPMEHGTRTMGYLVPTPDGWKVQGKRTLTGDAEVTLDSDLLVVRSVKESAPQFDAYHYNGVDLQPVNFYEQKAPQPVVKSGHFVLVNKRLNVLWHYHDGTLVKAYRVATGRQTSPPAPTWENYKTNFFTPEGNFRLTNFVENPPFNALKPGDISYAGGAPDNPLGTRWMGFSVLSGDNAWVWGIHGTSHPDQIGTWASDGCIRMYTQEAEELFAVLKGQNAALQVIGVASQQ